MGSCQPGTRNAYLLPARAAWASSWSGGTMQTHMLAGPLIPGTNRKDFSELRQFRNLTRTSEDPNICTRQPQTPDKRMGTLSAMFAKQEVPAVILVSS